jgi:hypothetical protein
MAFATWGGLESALAMVAVAERKLDKAGLAKLLEELAST